MHDLWSRPFRWVARHPRQIETGDEGPKAVEPALPADQLAMPRQKKVEGVQILDLQIRRIRLFAEPQRERSPHNEASFSSREFFVPAVSLGRARSSLRSRSKGRWEGTKVEPALQRTSSRPPEKKLKAFKF